MRVGANPRTIARSLALTVCFAAGQGLAQTQPAPSAAGKASEGKAIVDRDCVGCHAQFFAGDADRIYRRAERRVKTPARLLAQVQACNVNLGKGYFPEEEQHIVAYLNLESYKLAP